MAKNKRNKKSQHLAERMESQKYGMDIAPIQSDVAVDEEVAAEIAPTGREHHEDQGDYKTEFAQDVAPMPAGFSGDREGSEEQEVDEETDSGRGLGIAAIVLSLLSFFFLPFIMASAAIIVGIISVRRGSALGWWGISIGVIAMIIMLIAAPFRAIF
ncbi:DUF4190 domain-containing protein [Hazenella sp. IB182357]|uniref:DUF4190 domain-containing protein n=1 Tax=Polycladospora coralii TaxID=2771432 RepID=A0A926RT37_9BACL|nr:DUF4190 domain-containing protein [Polycladospora coralii]MBD1371203.1 DUF4190 domain-containing protein [Polycladospora coralii]MBS7530145.1 DUF4190 domain-containing protein [Polycladospora coralii]